MEIINIIVLYFLPSVFISTLLEYMLQYICHFFNCSNKLLVIYNFFFSRCTYNSLVAHSGSIERGDTRN